MTNRYPALALLELDSFAIGVFVADAMIKRSPITMLKSGTVSQGKYLILFGGSVASVEEAYAEGIAKGRGSIIDSVMLPQVHPQVHDAIFGRRLPCSGESLGIVELHTVASIMLAADKAVKGTGVTLVGIRMADQLAGRGFAIFAGKLEDVQFALEIAHEVVPDITRWVNETVIPRLHPEVAAQINSTTRFSDAKVRYFEDGEI